MAKPNKTRKFKAIRGKHDEAGVTYGRGEIVETENDLVAMFPNRFEEIVVTEAPAPVVVPDAQAEPLVEAEAVTEAPLPTVAPDAPVKKQRGRPRNN